jgi:hypothetical protein
MVRHYARSVGTLPNKGNNNGTVVQGAFKRENPQKPTKSIRSSMPVPSLEYDSCFLVSHMIMS